MILCETQPPPRRRFYQGFPRNAVRRRFTKACTMTASFDFEPRIRQMRRDDLTQIRSLDCDWSDPLGSIQGRDAGLEVRQPSIDPKPRPVGLVAQSDWGIIGYCLLTWDAPAPRGEATNVVKHIFVTPKWRGLGVGRRLCQSAADLVMKAQTPEVEGGVIGSKA